VMFVGERFADDDCVRAAELGKYGSRRTAGKKIRVVIVWCVSNIQRAERSRDTLIADFVSAKSLHSLHSRKFADGVGECERDRGMLVRRGISSRTEVEVGWEFRIHPGHNRLAK